MAWSQIPVLIFGFISVSCLIIAVLFNKKIQPKSEKSALEDSLKMLDSDMLIIGSDDSIGSGRAENNRYRKSAIEPKIIKSKGKTFGYDIFIGGRLTINEPHIRGLPGKRGFSNREKHLL